MREDVPGSRGQERGRDISVDPLCQGAGGARLFRKCCTDLGLAAKPVIAQLGKARIGGLDDRAMTGMKVLPVTSAQPLQRGHEIGQIAIGGETSELAQPMTRSPTNNASSHSKARWFPVWPGV